MNQHNRGGANGATAQAPFLKKPHALLISYSYSLFFSVNSKISRIIFVMKMFCFINKNVIYMFFVTFHFRVIFLVGVKHIKALYFFYLSCRDFLPSIHLCYRDQHHHKKMFDNSLFLYGHVLVILNNNNPYDIL